MCTNHQNAAQNVQNRFIEKTNGPFGRRCYLYDSIFNALSINPNQETFLADDVTISHFCKLKRMIKIKELPKC